MPDGTLLLVPKISLYVVLEWAKITDVIGDGGSFINGDYPVLFGKGLPNLTCGSASEI